VVNEEQHFKKCLSLRHHEGLSTLSTPSWFQRLHAGWMHHLIHHLMLPN